MFGLNTTIPFAKDLATVQIFVIFLSIAILNWLIFLDYKLKGYIKTNMNPEITVLDEHDLERTQRGIQNSIYALWLGMCLYLILYIIQ
jgi:hypothetical protein